MNMLCRPIVTSTAQVPGIQSARVAAAVTNQQAAFTSRLAMTEALGGPFAAYQQGKSSLPDGRRVSNWYLITPEGQQVGFYDAWRHLANANYSKISGALRSALVAVHLAALGTPLPLPARTLLAAWPQHANFP